MCSSDLLLFVERDHDVAAVGDDGRLLDTDDGFLLHRLAQGFLRAILLEAGAAIQQPVGVLSFLHACIVAQVWEAKPEDGNIRASFWVLQVWQGVMI